MIFIKRRYKLLIGFIISGIILIIIFVITKDKKIYYLSLGDSLAVGQTPNHEIRQSYGDYIKKEIEKNKKLEFYTKGFANEVYRSIDLLNDLKNNKKITMNGKELPIKHALIKADVVTVSIGMNDLMYKINVANEFDLDGSDNIYSYIDDVLIDIDRLLYELRKSCKEQIIVLGYYNPFINYSSSLSVQIEPLIVYANSKLKNLVNKYDMVFVDLHDLFLLNKKYLPNFLEIHPTNEGYRAIADEIIKLIDKKMLAK